MCALTIISFEMDVFIYVCKGSINDPLVLLKQNKRKIDPGYEKLYTPQDCELKITTQSTEVQEQHQHQFVRRVGAPLSHWK